MCVLCAWPKGRLWKAAGAAWFAIFPVFRIWATRLLWCCASGYQNGFDKFWFDCLNGDSRETGKTTPDGMPDPSVFSTESNKEGIRVGTTIGLMVRRGTNEETTVKFRHFWGVNKRADLLESLDAPNFEAPYQPADPSEQNRYSFRPLDIKAHYLEWPKVVDLCAGDFYQGLSEDRRKALMDSNKEAAYRAHEALF